MTKVENLIEKLSKQNLNDPYVNRIEQIRSQSKQNGTLSKFSTSKKVGEGKEFDENWDTFEDSTTWDNSWDQGVPN